MGWASYRFVSGIIIGWGFLMMGSKFYRKVEQGKALVVNLQRLVAIRESTDPEFIPERLRELYGAPFGDDQSTALERRIQEISALLR